MKLINNEKAAIALSILIISIALLTGQQLVGLGVVIILGLLSFFNKELGLLLLLIYIPVRPFLTALNPGLKVIGDFIILMMFLKTIYDYRQNWKELIKFQWFEYALFAFSLVGILAALNTGVGIVAIIFQIRAYILFYLVYYIVRRMEITQAFMIKGAMTTFITAVILSLHGFVEKISDKTLLMPAEWQEWGLAATNHVRVYGLIKGPNEFALYLTIAFLVSLYLLKFSKDNKNVWIFVGLSIIGAAFLLTYSRGAILALGVFVLAYLVLFRSFKGFGRILAVAIMSSLLFVVVTFAGDFYKDKVLSSTSENTTTHVTNKNEGKDRFKEAFSETTIEMSSSDGRIYYVKKAIEVFKDYPIVGSGFATFGGAGTLAYSSPIYKDYDILTDFYSDNQYILTLAETGIVGVLLLTVFVFHLLLITIKIYKTQNRELSILLLYFFTTLIVGGTVYNILENDIFMLYYFATLGIAYPYFKKHQRS